jgi:peptidylprolyl isomerase
MRRTLPALLLVLAACGGSADSSATPAVPSTTIAAAPETSVARSPLLPAEGCENQPDPADFVDGQIPTAVRPCEIPVALVTSTVRAGVGREAQDGDTMIVDYIGIRAEDGAIFDESYSRGVPIQFPLGRGSVIQGWDDGLVGTQAGSLVKLDVPAELAYGDTPPGGESSGIQPGDALSFVIEVRAVIAPVTAQDAPLDLDLEPSIGATEVTVTELVPGDGAIAEPGDTAVVHLLLVRGDNEVVLYNTWERSDPVQIVLEEGQPIPGILEGLQGARVGSTIEVAMPPDKAFGPNGETSLGLPAGVDLIAVIEVVGVF